MRAWVLAALLAVVACVAAGCPGQQQEIINDANRQSLIGAPRNISSGLLQP